MNILFLSDLHLDVNGKTLHRNLTNDLISFINSKQAELVIISGDLMGCATDAINVLDEIQADVSAKIVFVPGNHDVWTTTKSSWDGYNAMINHSSSIVNNPYMLENNWCVLGFMGWYDYSFGLKTIPKIMYPQLKKKLWKDAAYALWGMNDQEFIDLLIKQLIEQLDLLKDKQIILSTHFIPYDAFIVHKQIQNWNITNGFMGSEAVGNILDKYPNIKYVSFGHTHKRFGEVEFKNKKMICNPLGYEVEWEGFDFLTELEKSSTLVTINN